LPDAIRQPIYENVMELTSYFRPQGRDAPLLAFYEKLKKLIVETLNLEDIRPEEIEDDEPLFGGKFGLDSIDAVEIVFQVEQNFGVGIKNMKEGRPALQSINTLAAFIEARL